MNFLTESIDFLTKDINSFTLDDTKKLQELIKYHSDLYYNKEKPIISDSDYDKLFKKLEILEEKFDIKNKQTSKVWAELIESSFKKVKHSRPMISLDNTYNEDDLKDFDERVIKNIWDEKIKKVKYTIEFKFDWLWVELIYKNWKLVQAITRWNGIEGEDVTQNVMQIDNIPKEIDYKDHLEIRWEVVMPISSFEELNKKALESWEKVFSNPRNAASWSLRMKDNRITKQRKLKFFAYDLANFEEFRLKEKISKYYDVIKDLEWLAFDISSYFEVCDSIEEVINKIDNFGDLKKELDFEIDGLVIKVNNIDLWEKIGWTEHHPKYAIAYKFPAEILTTKILSVDHQVWRTGTVTPVANLEPINIGWAVIKRATLHNYEEVDNLWIAVWDYVFIKRAWEVIPKIISLAEKGLDRKKIEVPKICPSCGGEVKKDDDKVRYFCDNKNCPEQIKEKLVYAVGKNWFNMDWLWEKQIRKFYELWFIKDLADIFELEKYKEDILALEWFQEKSVDNIINSIEKAKKVEIATLINSLSIPWVGKKTAKILAKLFKNEDDLLNFSYSLEDVEALEDIWPEIWQNVLEFFTNKENKELLQRLVDILDINYYQDKTIDSNSLFAWKKVCITGSFVWENWEKIPRDNLIKKLEEAWGNFVSSVSKNTDYLLAWEKAGSKLDKAEKLGVKIINLTYFFKNV